MKGQTLITLLIFMVVATTIITGATLILIINNRAVTEMERSQLAYSTAESGAENAMLRLLRDPTYSGETMTVGEGTAEVTVVNGGLKNITSIGNVDGFMRTIEVVAEINNGVITIMSWKEVY